MKGKMQSYPVNEGRISQSLLTRVKTNATFMPSFPLNTLNLKSVVELILQKILLLNCEKAKAIYTWLPT